MRLIISNVNTKIEYKEQEDFIKYFDKKLHTTIDPLDPQRYRKSSFRKHFWDGRINIYNMKTKEFPTGLLSDVIDIIKTEQKSSPGLDLDITDRRGAPITPKRIPKKIILEGTPKGDLVLDPNDKIRGYQYDAVKFALEEQRGVINLAVNAGKAASNDTLVPLPDGASKRVGDVKVGDYLLGQDGKATKVLAIYPQPRQELYKVTLADKRSFTVTGEHLIPVYPRSKTKVKSNIQVKTLNDIKKNYKHLYLDKNRNKHSTYEYFLPMVESVQYKERRHVINPYALGILLAEGSLNDLNRVKNLAISTNEPGILDKFMKSASLDKYTHTDANFSYHFSQKNNPNVLALINEVFRLDLNHLTQDKFIPDEYLYDSEEHRLELLRALIDADGYIGHNTGTDTYTVSFSTSSEKLKDTFLTLVDGLGIGRNLHVDSRKDRNTNYQVTLFTPLKIWSSKKHEEQAKGLRYNSIKHLGTSIRNIEPVGQGESTCFTVDNKDHLYLLDDYVVTHNTTVAEALIKEDLKILSPDDKIFFMCGSKIIAYQSQKRISDALHIPVGFWGDGKKDIQQVTCVLVGTVNAALKDPAEKVKLTSNKEKMTKAMATKYAPMFIGYPNLNLVLKNFINNNKPRYKYEEEIWNVFSQMVSSGKTNIQLRQILEWYIHDYKKLIRKKNSKMFDKYEDAQKILDGVKVLIVDELQHAGADSYHNVINNMPNARQRIGLSGTIFTDDTVKWAKIKSLFSEKIIKVTNEELIDKGISAKPFVKLVPVDKPTNLDEQVDSVLPLNMPKNQEALMTYQELYNQGVVNNEYRNRVIAKLVDKLYETNQATLIVVNSVEHGENIQEMLEEMNIEVAFLKGEVSTEDRQTIIDNIRNGKIKVVIGTSLINEGMDLPNLKYLIYASAGKSSIAVIQRIGRVLRISDTKKTTIVFDIVDRTSKLLYKQAKARVKIYQDEQFQIVK